MTGLRLSLDAGPSASAALAARLPEPRAVKAALDVERLLGMAELRAPRGLDLDAVKAELERDLEARGSFLGTRARLLRTLPWVLFYPIHPASAAAAWLGANPKALGAIRELVAERPRLTGPLARAFLAAYPTGLATFESLRGLLARAAAERVRASPDGWLSAVVAAGLLSPTGHLALARAAMAHAEGLDGLARDLELVDLPSMGIARSAAPSVLSEVTTRLAGSVEVSWLLRMLRFFEARPSGTLRLTDPLSLAVALLSPFVTTAPALDVQRAIEACLARHLGDPRLRVSGGWLGAPEDIRAVLLRWLTTRSFEIFFGILDRTAGERHWSERKLFWSAYLQRGDVVEAWPVLGKHARSIAKTTDGVVQEDYGWLEGGDDPARSVLLLSIRGPLGRVTIAEASHSGSCRIWREGAPNAPKFYERRYTPWILRAHPAHTQPHVGGWQFKIRALIRDLAGIRNV